MPRLLPTRFATECIHEFDLAATERYRDAVALSLAGRRTGAIHLYGYVVEMLLKAAYFRVLRFGDTTPVDLPAMRAAVGDNPASVARTLGLAGTRNLHDIGAWAELLVAFRTTHGPVYPDVRFGVVLIDRVGVVRERWSETIRYHKNTAYEHELERVESACRWLVDHRYELCGG
jgi:hypothetical protein